MRTTPKVFFCTVTNQPRSEPVEIFPSPHFRRLQTRTLNAVFLQVAQLSNTTVIFTTASRLDKAPPAERRAAQGGGRSRQPLPPRPGGAAPQEHPPPELHHRGGMSELLPRACGAALAVPTRSGLHPLPPSPRVSQRCPPAPPFASTSPQGQRAGPAASRRSARRRRGLRLRSGARHGGAGKGRGGRQVPPPGARRAALPAVPARLRLQLRLGAGSGGRGGQLPLKSVRRQRRGGGTMRPG